MKIVSIETEDQILEKIRQQSMSHGSRLQAIRIVMDTFKLGVADAVRKYDTYVLKQLANEKYE